MCSTVFHELRRRGNDRIAFDSHHPQLYRDNPEVDALIYHSDERMRRWLRKGLPFTRLDYATYGAETDADEPPREHILATICRRAGLTGQVGLRPYLYLKPEELAAGHLGQRQIAIQSSGRAAAHHMLNKEWFPERFQQVCSRLCVDHFVVQIGSLKDPKLEGALDLRGQTTVRESAAILANSLVFIGLVGFLMHLARAVDCRSVIVFGGREKPWQSGYIANLNITGDTPCSPCWLRNRCDYHRACMDMISAPSVFDAAERAILMKGQTLETQMAEI